MACPRESRIVPPWCWSCLAQDWQPDSQGTHITCLGPRSTTSAPWTMASTTSSMSNNRHRICWNMLEYVRSVARFFPIVVYSWVFSPWAEQAGSVVGCSRSTVIVFEPYLVAICCYVGTTLKSHSMCRRITARVALWDWVWCARIECCIARCLQIS